MYNGHGCPCGLIQMIEAVFFAMGLIIFVGFFSILFFERTKIPDVLILMSIGARTKRNLSDTAQNIIFLRRLLNPQSNKKL